MKTLFVNFFGGPSTGKSTHATGLFSLIKRNGINAEYVSEYAKDKVWGEDFKALTFQPYILGKQMYKQYRLIDKVDVAITDSPILLGTFYKGWGCTESWEQTLLQQYNLFNNLNIILERNPIAHPYNPKGRTQTEDEAIAIDKQIKNYLDEHNMTYHIVKVTPDEGSIQECLRILNQHLS